MAMRAALIGTLMIVVAIGWRAGGGHPPAPAPAAPRGAEASQAAAVTLERDGSGHFFADGAINGKSLRFVVDTGATTVAIGRNDALAIGLPVGESDFVLQAATAAGPVRAARIRLPSIRVGTILLMDVDALVLDVPETVPMLGQSFLARLDGIAIEGDRMTLRKA